MKNISNNKHDFTIGGMYGSSGAYIVEDLSKSFDNLVIILDNNNQAISFRDELLLFIDNKNKISLYLDIECFPYENIIIDNDVVSERLKTYRHLLTEKKKYNSNYILGS